MRKLMLGTLATGALILPAPAPAAGDDTSCNPGTANAHHRVPHKDNHGTHQAHRSIPYCPPADSRGHGG